MIHDATPSWSGFNYQGKLAIYYVLCHIYEKLTAYPRYTFQNESIVLENNEDFEFLVGGTLTSFHQVKAYEKGSFSAYQDALFGLALNLYNQPGPLGYIHTWKVINLPQGRTLQQAIEDFIRELMNAHEADPQTSTIYKAINATPDRNKTAKIIQQAFDGLTVDQVFSALQAIVDDTSLVLERIHSYIYNGRECCAIDEINDLIKAKINEILVLRGGVNSSKQIDNSFHHLLHVLDVYVTNRHKQKQAAQKLSIDIPDVVSILDEDYEDVSSKYLAIEFKERFICLIDEFMDIHEYYTFPDEQSGIVCNLSSIRQMLLSVTPEQLFSYYKNFSPTVKFESGTTLAQALSVNENGVTDVLLRIFNDINCSNCENDIANTKLVYRSPANPKNYYLPTTINDRSPSNISKKLRANTRIVEDLYEINHMIYDGPERLLLSEHTSTHTTAPAFANYEAHERRNDYFSNLQLISIQQAKEELNVDNSN